MKKYHSRTVSYVFFGTETIEMNRREALKLALGATAFAALPVALIDTIVDSDIPDTEFAQLLRPKMEKILQQFVFEPNDELTRYHVYCQIQNFLYTIKKGNGISDYCIICDETNNPPSIIDKNQLHVDVFLQKIHSMVHVPIILTKS